MVLYEMFEKYKEFIKKYISFNIIEWKLFSSKLTIKEFKKGEVILHQGEICEELYFINHGLARAYIIDESGKDFTWSIFFNDENSNMTNLFIVDYDSFLHQKPSSVHIEALEDIQVVVNRYEDVQFLYDKLKKGERFGRLMGEAAYSHVHKKIIDRQTKSTNERFEDFMATTPHLLEKVPQYHIATLLGITPQHLSRLKKEYKN
jgi:CRP-like cAMP-binding protein